MYALFSSKIQINLLSIKLQKFCSIESLVKCQVSCSKCGKTCPQKIITEIAPNTLVPLASSVHFADNIGKGAEGG
jgi:hypothetical protein